MLPSITPFLFQMYLIALIITNLIFVLMIVISKKRDSKHFNCCLVFLIPMRRNPIPAAMWANIIMTWNPTCTWCPRPDDACTQINYKYQ